MLLHVFPGADLGFQVGGGALKKNWAERREAQFFFLVFRVKNHDFIPKNLIFSNFSGVRPPPPPSGSAPAFRQSPSGSLREFPENCVYRHGGFNCFIKYLHRKLLTTNFSRMILKVLKNVHLLDLYIKTIIFLLYNYIHVFNSSQND